MTDRWKSFEKYLALNSCFSNRNIFQNGVDALSKIDDAFLKKKKADNFSSFSLSDNVQILLVSGINTYYGITNRISYFRCQHLQIRRTPLEHQLFTRIFAFKLFHVFIAVANSISSKYYF